MQVQRVTGPSVGVEGTPGVRASARLDPNALDPIARGLQDLGGAAVKIMEQEQEKANIGQLLEAQRKLGDWERSWFDPANPKGVYSARGRDALGVPDKIAPDFEKVQAEIAANLHNPAVRDRFMQFAYGKRESVLDRVNGYVAREHDGYVEAEFKAQGESLAQSSVAAAVDGRWDDHGRDVRQALQTIRAHGKLRGEPPEVTQLAEQAFVDGVELGVLDSHISTGDFEAAGRHLDQRRETLSPAALIRAQARLEPALQERRILADVERIEQGAAPGVAGVSADYRSKRRQLESGGRNDAANPNSSALGPDQFVELTWTNLVAREQPAWAKGKTKAQILAMRTDPDKSGEMADALDRENGGALQRAGFPVTDHGLYLAHHFGPAAAVKILGAPDGTPMSRLISPAQYEANPYLKGKTKAEMIANHERRGMRDEAPAASGVEAWSGTPTLADKMALVDATVADPVYAGKLKQALRQREGEQQAARAAATRAVVDSAWDTASRAPPSMGAEQLLAAVPGADQLDGADRVRLSEQLRVFQENRLKGTLVQDDPTVVDALERQIALAGDDFLRTDIRSHSAKLSGDTMNRFLAVQAAMREKGKQSPKVAEARTEAEMFQSTFAELGLSGKKADAKKQLLRDRYAAEKKAFIDAHGGRAPTEDEREAIRGRLLVYAAKTTPGWFGDNVERKRLYELEPGEEGYRVEVPPQRDAAIRLWLARRGHKVTDANVRAVYLRTGGAPVGGGR